MELKLESRALKASVVLDPAVLAGVVVPNGLAKVTLRVAAPHTTIVAEVNAKTSAQDHRGDHRGWTGRRRRGPARQARARGHSRRSRHRGSAEDAEGRRGMSGLCDTDILL